VSSKSDDDDVFKENKFSMRKLDPFQQLVLQQQQLGAEMGNAEFLSSRSRAFLLLSQLWLFH
jgi:hypothetical protein